MSTAVLLCLSFVLGAVIGSFLNVVVYRLPRGESVVLPPSHCPSCGQPVRPRDNIPVVSWLLLRGRCRSCAAPISARYPVVEAACGVLFVAVAAKLGTSATGLAALPAFFYLAAVGLALGLIDLATKKLPNKLTLPSYLIGPGLLVIPSLVGHTPGRLLGGLLGLVAFYLPFYLAWFVSAGRWMGFGDVKLAGILGFYLGWLGLGPWLVGLLGGSFIGALGSLALVAARRAQLRGEVPYGPWMLLGALLGILAGEPLLSAYLHASGLA